MDQPSHNVVRLESSRSMWAFGLSMILLLTCLTAAGSIFFLGLATKGEGDVWFVLEMGVGCLVITGLFVAVAFSFLQKIRVPDVLEFSPGTFRYVSTDNQNAFSVPWSEVGPPEVRRGNKGDSLYVEVAGASREFGPELFGVSMETLVGMINSALAGNITTKAEWLEPDKKNSPFAGFCAGLAVAAVSVAVIGSPFYQHAHQHRAQTASASQVPKSAAAR